MTKTPVERRTVDLSLYPELMVIYSGIGSHLCSHRLAIRDADSSRQIDESRLIPHTLEIRLDVQVD